MDKFIIDRQFGQAIWIDVVNGVVKRCYNDVPKFNKRMNEFYKGKSISFLKKDFEARMKPIYHNVRPEAILISLHNISAIESRIKANWRIISGLSIIYSGKDGEQKQALQKAREISLKEEIGELEHELYDAEQKLNTEKERIITEHNYKS